MNRVEPIKPNSIENNLFHAIAAEVAKGNFTEFYLRAGQEWDFTGATDAIRNALRTAEEQCASDLTKVDVLGWHYSRCGGMRSSPGMGNGASGVIDTDGVVVEYSIKDLKTPQKSYRVLFSRVDTAKLYFDVQAQLQDMLGRLARLEQAAL